jgi:hypothetical protein
VCRSIRVRVTPFRDGHQPAREYGAGALAGGPGASARWSPDRRRPPRHRLGRCPTGRRGHVGIIRGLQIVTLDVTSNLALFYNCPRNARDQHAQAFARAQARHPFMSFVVDHSLRKLVLIVFGSVQDWVGIRAISSKEYFVVLAIN